MLKENDSSWSVEGADKFRVRRLNFYSHSSFFEFDSWTQQKLLGKRNKLMNFNLETLFSLLEALLKLFDTKFYVLIRYQMS